MKKMMKTDYDMCQEPHELVKKFIEHCNDCEHGCPLGCKNRLENVKDLLSPNSWMCNSILHCFASFALEKKKVNNE